ncbi:MAG: redox-regulated ATPase YchF [Bacteroidales bacterium]|nr:redox-regulated ATPase YchF [Bacteroidales bacterium]
MALKCGIIGITNTGKTTIFNCVSNTKAESSNFVFSTNKSNIGQINVPDPRLDKLSDLVKPQKTISTSIEIVDIPGMAKGSSKGEGVGNSFLADIRQTDALIHVLRCFDDENLPHVEGSIDPVRDKEIIDFEMLFKDLESVEKKKNKIEKLIKAGEKGAKHDLEIINEYIANFEKGIPARLLNFDEDKTRVVSDLFLLTEKPVLYVCNVDEKSAVGGNKYVELLKESVKNENAEVLIIAGRSEEEIAELENYEDKLAFLEDLGLTEPGVNKMVRAAYKLLNLQTFFTAGPKEVRAWTIRAGMTAPQAAGVIHSDLERGFIRAEVIKYNDYISLGSENACKAAGKFYVEGKSYIVQDGDLLNIRFNV